MVARQSDDTAGGMAVRSAIPYGNQISAPRIFALSVVSFGLYLFYWVYRTWEQYRQHTGANVYPVWHALAMLVPIYGWFRFYAHCKAYRDLMEDQGVPHDLKMAPILVVLIICTALWSPMPTVWLNFYLGESDISVMIDLILDVVSLIGILVATAVVCRIQANCNRYWAAIDGDLANRARLGRGAMVLAALGVILWFTIAGYYVRYYLTN
ncbi:MAG: hypothetical protein OXL37_08370 [Chloroflexota bacterium]|nr:hypothetical protein [Chloroflexota bacterium]MDE2959633.1 hypothetical protein [Chloroflexota bacterium]